MVTKHAREWQISCVKDAVAAVVKGSGCWREEGLLCSGEEAAGRHMLVGAHGRRGKDALRWLRVERAVVVGAVAHLVGRKEGKEGEFEKRKGRE